MEDDLDDEANETTNYERPEQIEEIEAYVTFARVGKAKRALLCMDFGIQLPKA